MIAEIWECSADQIDISSELLLADGMPPWRAAESEVFGQQLGKEAFVEAVPHLVVESAYEFNVATAVYPRIAHRACRQGQAVQAQTQQRKPPEGKPL
jgi:hypothetical protein